MAKRTIGNLAKEIAWVVSNAIIDSSDEDIGKIELRTLVKIREIIEMETDVLLNDWIGSNDEKSVLVNDILNKVQ